MGAGRVAVQAHLVRLVTQPQVAWVDPEQAVPIAVAKVVDRRAQEHRADSRLRAAQLAVARARLVVAKADAEPRASSPPERRAAPARQVSQPVPQV